MRLAQARNPVAVTVAGSAGDDRGQRHAGLGQPSPSVTAPLAAQDDSSRPGIDIEAYRFEVALSGGRTGHVNGFTDLNTRGLEVLAVARNDHESVRQARVAAIRLSLTGMDLP